MENAVGINAAGQILGVSGPGDTGIACIWRSGNFQVLKPPPGFKTSTVKQINDRGQAAGILAGGPLLPKIGADPSGRG